MPLNLVKCFNVVSYIIVFTNHSPNSDGGDSDGGSGLLTLQKNILKKKERNQINGLTQDRERELVSGGRMDSSG